MKKLMLLAAMLAMVLVAAVPALAQNIEPAAGIEPRDEDELICLLPEGCDMDVGIEPAPGDVETAPGIDPVYDDVEPVHNEVEPVGGDIEPTPGDVEPVDCSEALEGSSIDRRASEPTSIPDGTSIIPAEEPGCFAIPVPAPA